MHAQTLWSYTGHVGLMRVSVDMIEDRLPDRLEQAQLQLIHRTTLFCVRSATETQDSSFREYP